MTKTQEMPKTIVLEDELKAIDWQLRADLRAAQEAYASLKEEEDLGEIPLPHELTEEWLNTQFEQAKKAVSDAKFLTAEQRKVQLMQWGRLYKRALGNVQKIQKFISGIPKDQYYYDAQLGTFYYSSITLLATERATHQVPEEAGEHWQKIQNILQTIGELRAWEAEHDVKKIPLSVLLHFSQSHHSEAWARGTMVRDHRFDNKPYMAATFAEQRRAEQLYL